MTTDDPLSGEPTTPPLPAPPTPAPPAPAPPAPAGSPGPSSGHGGASSAASHSGGGHGDDIEFAVLIDAETASLARVSARSADDRAGHLVGGAEEPGLQPD